MTTAVVNRLSAPSVSTATSEVSTFIVEAGIIGLSPRLASVRPLAGSTTTTPEVPTPLSETLASVFFSGPASGSRTGSEAGAAAGGTAAAGEAVAAGVPAGEEAAGSGSRTAGGTSEQPASNAATAAATAMRRPITPV